MTNTLSRHWPVLLPVLLAATGCGGSGERAAGDPDGPILVLAASDLQLVLPEIVVAYGLASGAPVEVFFGSTGNLTTQIENGAPGDVFLAANEAFLDRLEMNSHGGPGTRRGYATGRLALTWAPGVPPPDGLQGLVDPAYGSVAIANPEHAPYGAAARQALEAAGVWDALGERIVFAENVSQAHQFVRTGNAEAGLVALSVVIGASNAPYTLVDASLHAPLRQAGVVLAGSERPEAALRFLDFVASPAGQAILARFGFEPPAP